MTGNRKIAALLDSVAVWLLLWSAPANAFVANLAGPDPLPVIDAREGAGAAARAPEANATEAQRARAAELQARIPGLVLRWNALSGTPRSIHSLDSFLTLRSNDPPETVVRRFLLEQSGLFGLSAGDVDTLVAVRRTASPGSAAARKEVRQRLEHLALDQRHAGRQVYGATLVATVTGTGQLVAIAGEVLPDLATAVNADKPALTARQALAAAARSIGARAAPDEHRVLKEPRGAEERQTFSAARAFSWDVPVRLVYFPVARHSVRLVWELAVGKAGDLYVYQVFVDAVTGGILLRRNVTRFDTPLWLVDTDVLHTPTVEARSDMRPRDNPAPLSPGPGSPNGAQGTPASAVIVQTNGSPAASPDGWLAPGVDRTRGNNATALVDLDGTPPLDPVVATTEDVGGIATRSFRFAADPSSPIDTEANKKAATANAFFVANWYHDRLFDLGFDESAGNFQQINHSGQGEGEDPVYVAIQLVSTSAPPIGPYMSFFLTTGDGGFAMLNASLATGPSPYRDGGLDQQVLLHELTHGLTNRIVGGPSNLGLAGTPQALGMGEGYSDWYALTLLSRPEQDPSGNFASGAWFGLHLFRGVQFFDPPVPFTFAFEDNYYYGIRRYPYTTDLARSPLTLADTDPSQFDDDGVARSPFWAAWDAFATAHGRAAVTADEVHNIGEIWALALWEVRAALLQRYGWETGNELALQLVTDSLFLLGVDPTVVEARDAVLLADQARTGGENHCRLWQAFAKRGLGAAASVPAGGETLGVREDRGVPACCGPPRTVESAAKFVCARAAGLPRQLARASAVNVHNPNRDTVRLRAKVAAARLGREGGGWISPWFDATIAPDAVLGIGCLELFERAQADVDVLEGFLVVQAQKPLDLWEAHTSSPRAGSLDMDVERVAPVRAVRCPDLVVDWVGMPEWDAASGLSRVRAAIRNIGSAPAGESLAQLLDAARRQSDQVPTPPLGPCQASVVSLSLPYQLDASPVGVDVIADYKNDVAECDEGNNGRPLRGPTD